MHHTQRKLTKRDCMRTILIVVAWLCLAPLTIAAQDKELKIPSDVLPFVESGTKAIALEKSDLNGDGRYDFILVLEKEKPAKDADDFPVGQRPLLILLRHADGKLSVAKRNENIIMCSQCGGVFGEPFEAVIAKRNAFSVEHYGGSSDRWKFSYQFNYSRIDKTWQLVRVQEIHYHTSNPNGGTNKIYTAPRNFGKIDVADFDPDHYLKKRGKAKAGK
jgi:hypothetical protein